jgi:hypothetical protein
MQPKPPDHATAPSSRPTTVLCWLTPGLVAGVVFLAIAVTVGAATTTAWAMPESIAAAIGVPAPTDYNFAATPVLVGVGVHLATSIGLGVLYRAATRLLRIPNRPLPQMTAGVVFIGAESPISIHFLLGATLPTPTFHYFLDAIPIWAAIAGRIAYGLTLGLTTTLTPTTTTHPSTRTPVHPAPHREHTAEHIADPG